MMLDRIHFCSRFLHSVLAFLVLASIGCNGQSVSDTQRKPVVRKDSLEGLIELANVDTDEEFKMQLQGDYPAPEGFRKLLKGQTMRRWYFAQGISHEDGYLTLYWTNNCGIVGESEDVNAILLKRLSNMGFEQFESPDLINKTTRVKRYESAYRRKLAGAEETVLINHFTPWDGGNESVAGSEFKWLVRSTTKSPFLSYEAIRKEIPQFHDNRIDELFYKMFQDKPLARIWRHRTKSDYYNLQVEISCDQNNGESADELYPLLLKQIEQAGYDQVTKPQFSAWEMFRANDAVRQKQGIKSLENLNIQMFVPEDKSVISLAIGKS